MTCNLGNLDCTPLYEYQVKDVIRSSTGTIYTSPFQIFINSTPYANAVSGLVTTAPTGFSNITTLLDGDQYAKDLLCKHIFPKCMDKTLIVSDAEIAKEDLLPKLAAIMMWVYETRESHEAIINAISGISDFMAAVKDTNKVIFNDTPQTPSPDLDTHVTTYTKTENASDLATPIARISEIRNQYENEMQNWCNEFIDTFIIM